MKTSVVLARAGAVAIVAALLPAALQWHEVGTAVAIIGLVLLAIAAAAIWLEPGPPSGRTVALALSAPLMIVAAGAGGSASASTWVLAVAAGPLALALASSSLMRGRSAIAAIIAGGLIAGPLQMLVNDPFFDQSCYRCGHVTLAVWPNPELATDLAVVGWGMAVIATCWEVYRGCRAIIPVLVCLAAVAVGLPRQSVIALGGAAVAAVWARRCWTTWRRRDALRQLLALYEHGEGLTDTLRRATRDPGLLVTFPTIDGIGFVDAEGRLVTPTSDQSATNLFIHGALLARVHHDARTELPDLDAALDPAAGLMLQKERLTAQLAARVHELGQARTRVVRVGLEQRRTLERDLHDGIQQQLLALGLDIRLALGSLPGDSPDRATLDKALVLVHDCVEQVRAISTGVSPPLLVTRGLRAAAMALVRRHGAPVDIGQLPEGRLPPDIERAAYAVVAEALARGAKSIEAIQANGQLTVRAEGATDGGGDGVVPDLVAALCGNVRLDGPSIEAVIPCE